MSRYKVLPSDKEPGSRGQVLQNLLAIKSKKEMDYVEIEALISAQEKYYRNKKIGGITITANFICAMHKDWLAKIYSWAGKYRTVELSKGGFTWPPAYLVPEHMRNFSEKILAVHTPCQPDFKRACKSIAIVHAELLLIHPFYEGNGRISRWVADIMAYQAGYAPPESYGLSGNNSRKRKNEYLEAVKQGYLQNYEPLTLFFAELLSGRLSA